MDALAEAKARLLSMIPNGAQMSTGDLLDAAEQQPPPLSPDRLRAAYWELVKRGDLERTPTGVRRATR
jgi:hypothetical protein